MNVMKKQNGTILNIALEGRLDASTAPKLDEVLKDSLDSMSELTIDVAKLDYISYAGLIVLLSSYKKVRKKGGLRIKNPNETVKEVLNASGFADLIAIDD